jgi:uncharacterized protein affecting Mg2+/Co2+ transport
MRAIAPVALTALWGILLMTTDVTAADKPKPPEPGKAIPATTPLSLTVEGTAKYTLDANAKSEDDLNKGFATDIFPKPPAVDLKLVLKNTGDQPVQVWTSGDPVTVDLEVKGKGVVTVAPRLAMTLEFRSPMAVEIAAGKTVELPLKALAGGMRGNGQYVYWTQAGEVELVATLNTAVSPAPKGADATDDGFGKVKVCSTAFKITVEKK